MFIGTKGLAWCRLLFALLSCRPVQLQLNKIYGFNPYLETNAAFGLLSAEMWEILSFTAFLQVGNKFYWNCTRRLFSKDNQQLLLVKFAKLFERIQRKKNEYCHKEREIFLNLLPPSQHPSNLIMLSQRRVGWFKRDFPRLIRSPFTFNVNVRAHVLQASYLKIGLHLSISKGSRWKSHAWSERNEFDVEIGGFW